MNNLEYAKIFQDVLDEQLIQGATSGWMEPNSELIKYNGGKEIKIASIVMDGLGNYDRAKGFVDGSVSLTFKTHELTQDRGRTFSLDSMDVDETNFLATAGNAMSTFQKDEVIPEIDSYRYSMISKIAIAANQVRGGFIPTEANILKELLMDIAKIQDDIGDGIQLVITMSMLTLAMLNNNEKITKKLDVIDFQQGAISTKVKSIDNIPIIGVPSARLKTEYDILDGITAGEEKGGLKPSDDAKTINWIISARTAPIAVSKTDKIRIFDPGTNQKMDAWKIDYRKYHDLWITANKVKSVFVNIKEAL